MRLTLDANIIVRAAIRPAGPAGAVLELATRPGNRFVLSQAILDEVRRVLGYERIRKLSGFTPQEEDDFVSSLAELAEVIAVEDVPSVCSDPDDDVVVATAVAGGSDVLCTLDRHLRHPLVVAYCATHSIRVLTDLEVLTVLRKPKED